MAIKILSDDVRDKIAAGEVVERPASIVKELLENSIDAMSSEVDIYIEDGGKRVIKICDNGRAMNRDDAALAFERHATSKISSIDDLFSIDTLGFRGEALPSIGSVAKVELTTKRAADIEGTKVVINGGKIENVCGSGAPVGTSVEVRDIFYNTPARRKFLKTTNTEFTHIVDVINRTILAHDGIAFRLYNNGTEYLNVSINHDLLARAALVFGKDSSKNLFEMEWSQGLFKINGLLSKQDFNRSNSKSIYTFVNNRFVKDRIINHAVMESYRSIIPKERFPAVILFISIPPNLLDVNVHPAKIEVRFKDPKEIHNCVKLALDSFLKPPPKFEKETIQYKEKYDNSFYEGKEVRGELYKNKIREAISEYVSNDKKIVHEVIAASSLFKSGFYSSLQIVGQVKGSYIVCQTNKSLWLIDQHAAHERITYSKLKDEYYGHGIAKQSLLTPLNIDLGQKEVRVLNENIDNIKKLGFDIEYFGGSSFVLRAVPFLLAGADYNALIIDIVDNINYDIESRENEKITDKILISMSCHSSVKANQSLTMESMKALLTDLDNTEYSVSCLHGRPVAFELEFGKIEKIFKRR